MLIEEISCKSALVKSNLPNCDYVINPYTGCELACVYCYANFMCKFANKDFSDWGKFIQPKINIVDVLKKQLASKRLDKTKSIFISSVTDPYTYSEKKYHLTRQILELLLEHGWLGQISIQSKNPLIIRDMDLFLQLKNIELGMTITSDDDTITAILEGKAPLVLSRFKALEALHQASLKTYAFIGPLLPSYMDDLGKFEELIKKLKQHGISQIYLEFMNLKSNQPVIYNTIALAQGRAIADSFIAKLKDINWLINYSVHIKNILDKHNIKLKGSNVIRHSQS